MAEKISFGHPGRMGDCLYSLPTVKYLCEKYGVKADFWTSEYCLPLKRLFEYQSYIDKFYVSPSYQLRDWSCGGQPPFVPIPSNQYSVTYQLGFRHTPTKRLDHFIAESVGIDGVVMPKVQYEYPNFETLDEPYVVLDTRGETSYNNTFLEFARLYPYKTVIVGGVGNFNQAFLDLKTQLGDKLIDLTGLDFLETATWMSKAKGFVGLMSSQLVLANGFPDLIKVIPHDGRSWHMGHVIYSDTHYYLVDPNPQEMIDIICN